MQKPILLLRDRGEYKHLVAHKAYTKKVGPRRILKSMSLKQMLTHTHTHINASNKTLVPLLRLVPIGFHSPPGVKEKKRDQETVFVMT